MKNTLILLAVLVASPCACVLGQDSLMLSRTVFKLSPQHFVHNSLKAGVERFNPNHSSSFAVFLTGRVDNNSGDFYEWGGYSGLAGEFQLRKYVSPMKTHTSRKNNTYHQGIYGSAYVQGGSYSGDFTETHSAYDPNTGTFGPRTEYSYKESIGNWGFGFTIGYQKTLWQVIFLEAFIGGGIQFADITLSGSKPDDSFFAYETILDPGYKGMLPKIGINLGLGL